MSKVNEYREAMTDRFLEFAVQILRLKKDIKKSFGAKHCYRQLFRSGTSSGANFEESHSAQSNKDFIHKREIALNELRESLYWLKLFKRGSLAKSSEIIEGLVQENEELIKIIAKGLVTKKQNGKAELTP